jgi:predicted nucleic acid-binding protein
MTPVTNTGPLVALAKLNHLHLLSTLFDTVIIPRAVYRECVLVGQERGYRDAKVIRAFLERMDWHPLAPPTQQPTLANDVRLGKGEIEAIALAEHYHSLLLIDDVYARAVAERMGVQTVGTIGILVTAYRQRNLAPDVFEELLMTIEQRSDIWIHPDLCLRVRQEILGQP